MTRATKRDVFAVSRAGLQITVNDVDDRLRDRWMKREVREALSDVRAFGLAPYDIMNS